MIESKLLDCVKENDQGIFIDINVSPGSSENKIKGVNKWRKEVEIDISAEAKKGEANKELVDHLSSLLHISKDKIDIVQGSKSNRKRLFIFGLRKDKVVRSLENEFSW